jgi:hypothetical protein
MALRDRFWTPVTAKAILSWRILVGAAAGVVAGLIGIPIVGAVVIGLGVYAGSVALAMPREQRPVSVDPFTVSEPWRQMVQAAQRSRQRFLDTVAATPAGPLHDRLRDIGVRLDGGLAQGWAVARRGHEIDASIRHHDPTALRSRLATLQARAATAPSEDLTASIASVEQQLASVDRLKALSESTADRMRLTVSRLDELAVRATEVSIGSGDSERFASDVDDLVLELEGLRQAVQELPG